MRVIVNGEQREVNSASVDALLSELDYEGTHFAIALNYNVVPKSRWAETALKAGDEIEIITPRQGGGGEALYHEPRRHPEVRAVFGSPRRMAASGAVILRGAHVRAPQDDGLCKSPARKLKPW